MTRAAALLGAIAVFAGTALASDGGSGTYTATGSTYDFVFFNSGTAAWQYFYVVAPPGARFLGGGTISEASPRCAVGEPDGRPGQIECGPLPPSLAPSHVHFGFAATLGAPAPCGSPFQLYVSYLSQRCSKQACSAIRGATKLRLRLTARDRARAVRLVATAGLDGTTAVSRSGKISVR